MANVSANALLTKFDKNGDTQSLNFILGYESPLQESVMSIALKKISSSLFKSSEIATFFELFKIDKCRNDIKKILYNILHPAAYCSLQPKFPQGYDILSNFGTSSAELNSSIFEYLYTNLPFYSPQLHSRYNALLNGFVHNTLSRDTITVFHGTNFPIHSRDTFKTFAFMSTSIEYQVARSYGKIIYAILVPSNFPYLNLCDKENKQVLLPIATKVRVLASVQNVRFCVVDNDRQTVMSVLKSLIDASDSTPCNDLIYMNTDTYESKLLARKKDMKGSSRFFTVGNYLIKQSILATSKQYTYLRCLNEILACRLYATFGCQTLNLELVMVDDKYAVKSEYLNKIQYCLQKDQARELLRGYIVDCVLSNWDVGYFKNAGYHNGNIIRTDVGGALAYRARGEFKLSFFNNYDVNEHVTMLSAPLIKQCVLKVGLTPNDTANLMYEIFNEHKDFRFEELERELEQWPEFFTKQVLQQVYKRIDYYKKNMELVKHQIITGLLAVGGTRKSAGDEQVIVPSQESGSVCGANSIINRILTAPKCSARAQGGKIDLRGKLKKKMKIISWNINGLRAVLDKNKAGKRGTGEKHVIQELIDEYDPDVLCLQETKCPADFQAKLPFEYSKILASSTKKGYSGVAVYSKIKPLRVLEDFPMNEEGRVLVFEFEKLYVLNTYTPNSKPDLSRLEYRTKTWEKEIRAYVNKLQKNKPVVYVSDFNVAATELDIHTTKGHERAHGFTIEERTAFADLLKECDMIDSWRDKHPGLRKYTWYSNFAKARERNKGWRIDGALVSKNLASKIEKTDILSDYMGSDHIPVYLELSL